MKGRMKLVIKNCFSKEFHHGKHALAWLVLSRMAVSTVPRGSMAIVIADRVLAFAILGTAGSTVQNAKIHITE